MENQIKMETLKTGCEIKPMLDRLYENIYMRRAFLIEATEILQKHEGEVKQDFGIDKTSRMSQPMELLYMAWEKQNDTLRMLLSERVTTAQTELAKAEEMLELYLQTLNL